MAEKIITKSKKLISFWSLKLAKIKKKYDCIIFGGGFSGLLAANILLKKNKSFLIIEASENLGGRLTGWAINDYKLNANLNLYSASDANLENFKWLEELTSKNILDGQFTLGSYHFKDGEFKDFNGFGKRKPIAIDPLNQFCFETEKLKMLSYPQDWISQLIQAIPENQILTHSEVTHINTEEAKATSVEINGKYTVECETLIWANAPQDVLSAIDPQILGSHDAKKLKRHPEVFDAIILSIYHKDFIRSEKINNSILCLYGSQEEFEPVIGTISENQSCWMSFVPSEQSGDNEFIAKVIRNMKKQIKRPYPELFEHPDLQEKIILSQSSYGQLKLKEDENGFLKTVNNLFFTSSLCSENASGLTGSIERIRRLEAQL